MVLKVIDGKATKGRAPRPRKGLVRAVYDTIDGLGGATFAQIWKYLPTCIEDSTAIGRKTRVRSSLHYGVRYGYFIHQRKQGLEYWHIAPIEYYEAQQAYRDERTETSMKGMRRRKHLESQVPAGQIIIKRPFWHYGIIVGVAGCSFAIGVIAELLVCAAI